MDITKIITILIPFRGLFLLVAGLLLVLITVRIVTIILDKVNNIYQKRKQLNKDRIKNLNIKTVAKSTYGKILRILLSPDGIDPNILNHFTITDGGHTTYIRTFTIKKTPRETVFNQTFVPLFNFPNVTSSVFIIPQNEETMQRKFDKHITILTSEHDMAANDVNRRRKLKAQIIDATESVKELEAGDNKFFDVGFLFSLYADSLEELDKQSDAFYAVGLGRGVSISSCFGAQAEAYAMNGPFNNTINVISDTLKKPPITYLQMDKKSVSTLLNFTQSSFSHKSGVPIGRDLFTGDPYIFDLDSPSHDAMTMAVAGIIGSGKTLFVKTMCARQLPFNKFHYVAIDCQEKKGTSEGEYAALAVAAGGVNFKIANNSEDGLNLMEVSETIRSVQIAENQYKEERTVDLASKITTFVNNICTLLLNNKEEKFDTVNDQTMVQRIITDIATQTYNDFGIYDGDPDSLYEDSSQMTVGTAKRKLQPKLSNFYERLLKAAKNNKEKEKIKGYQLLVYGLQDRIKELYYTQNTLIFLTRAQYESLATNAENERFIEIDGKIEKVIAIKGTKAYYDVYSSVFINKDCPFTNFDISQLPDDEQRAAQQICMGWIKENHIKKNSESLAADIIPVLIVDEAHREFNDPYCRKELDDTARTLRKRHCGLITITQTMREYDDYKETRDIRDQSIIKVVFKQAYGDKSHLIEKLNITSSQADIIVSQLGGSGKTLSEEEQKKRRGECCFIDGKKVSFVKVDYIKKTEQIIADTNAAIVQQLLQTDTASRPEEKVG